MTSWTIGRKLLAGAGLLIALVIAVGLIAWRSSASIQGRLMETGNNTARRLALSLETQAAIEGIYSAQRGMILAAGAKDMPELSRQHARARDEIKRASEQLEQLAPLMRVESGKKAVAFVRQRIEDVGQFHGQLEALLRADRTIDAYEHFQREGVPLHGSSVEKIRIVVTNQGKFLSADMGTASASYAQIRLSILVSFALAFAVAIVFVAGVRGIVRTLRSTCLELSSGAQQVSRASGQVASAAEILSQGSTEQAASLEETSASMEEMASMTRRNAENAHRASALMNEVDRQVAQSNATLGDAVTAMTAIQESSVMVSKIIRTIDEIAFQTNILALNAAVEAARAGDAGMGFAVVADEVRNLAHRSAQAARDTTSLIEEASAKAQQGNAKVEQVAGAIASITESILRVKGLVEEVSVASGQQAQGIDQVTQAVVQMEKVTQSTAATAEESAAASEELTAQAEHALGVIVRLQQLVGRTTTMTGADNRAAVADQSASSRPGAPITVVKRSAGRRSAEEAFPLETMRTSRRF